MSKMTAEQIALRNLLSEGAPSEEQIEAEALERFPELEPDYASMTYPAEALRTYNRAAFASGARWATGTASSSNHQADALATLAAARVEAEELTRQGYPTGVLLRILSAGVAPQEPTLCVECGETEVLGKPEHRVLCMDCAYETGVHAGHRTQALDPEKVKAWLQREFGSVLAHDPHNPERFWGGSARALCEAYTEGGLT